MLRRLLVAAVLIAGCRTGAKAPTTFGDVADTPSMGAAPAQFSDLAPGDTAAVVDMMRATMRSIDGGLAQMSQRDTVISTPDDSITHHLTIWLEEGVPRKLSVVDSAGHGQNNTQTDVWFMGGDVAIVLEASDAFAFDADRIVLWTDEALVPRSEVTQQLLMAKQSELISRVQGWLAKFGISAPQ